MLSECDDDGVESVEIRIDHYGGELPPGITGPVIKTG
jgi:hypothetical protein